MYFYNQILFSNLILFSHLNSTKNFRYAEAEAAITNNTYNRNTNLDELVTEYGEHAAFTLMLLAKIATKTERWQRAAEAFKRALKINPFLWNCYENLCNMGENPNPNTIFQLNELENMSHCHGSTLNNIESVYLSNSTPCMDGQVFITPQQIINSANNSPGYTPNVTSKMCTPDDVLSTNNLCLSGLGLLPKTKMKSLRFRNDSLGGVSDSNFSC